MGTPLAGRPDHRSQEQAIPAGFIPKRGREHEPPRPDDADGRHYNSGMPDRTELRAITLDLDDTLWPVAPTLIAAERSGRVALLMEIDPGYCDVIVKRWEDFTGKKAMLEESKEAF
jgi:hypothetical protein